MRIINIHISLFLLLGLFFTACKDGKDGEPGPDAKVLSGDVTGFVKLVNTLGNYNEDHSGVQVTVEGLPGVVATTDAKGKFVFKGLEGGNFNFIVKKNGYGTYKYMNVKHVGGPATTLLNEIIVGELNDYPLMVEDFSIFRSNSIDYIRLRASSYSGDPGHAIVFFGKTEDVGPSKYLHLFSMPVQGYSNTSSSYIISVSSLYNAGFTSGEKVYAKFYPLNNFASVYSNPITNRTVWPALSTFGTPAEPITLP